MTLPISVLIPAYKPEYIAETLRSVLAQDEPAAEIIISDDCPTDAVEKAVAPFLEKHPEIRYKRNIPSLGLAANYLQLSRMAQQPWLKYVDDDDLLEPDAVRLLYAAASADSKVSLVMSAIRHFGEGMKDRFDRHDLPAVTDGATYLDKYYLKKNPITLFTRLLVRKDVMDTAALLDVPSRIISLDELTGILACSMGRIAYISDVTCHHRQHSAGYSGTLDLDVLCDDITYVVLPCGYARQRKLIPEKILDNFETTLLTKLFSATMAKLLKHGSLREAKFFRSFAQGVHPKAARKAAFAPRVLKRRLFAK